MLKGRGRNYTQIQISTIHNREGVNALWMVFDLEVRGSVEKLTLFCGHHS